MSSRVPTEVVAYCNLMKDLRERITLVSAVLNRSVTTGNDTHDIELVFIQLRKTLENIAFGSLLANNAIYSAVHAKFAEHWNAKRLLLDIEPLNKDFYPVPVRLVETKPVGDNRNWHQLEYVTTGFLTKDEFVTLYEKCGDVLHTRNPFSTKSRVANIGYSVKEWVSRIQALLALHIVTLVGKDSWIVTIPNSGEVTASIFRAATEDERMAVEHELGG